MIFNLYFLDVFWIIHINVNYKSFSTKIECTDSTTHRSIKECECCSYMKFCLTVLVIFDFFHILLEITNLERGNLPFSSLPWMSHSMVLQINCFCACIRQYILAENMKQWKAVKLQQLDHRDGHSCTWGMDTAGLQRRAWWCSPVVPDTQEAKIEG